MVEVALVLEAQGRVGRAGAPVGDDGPRRDADRRVRERIAADGAASRSRRRDPPCSPPRSPTSPATWQSAERAVPRSRAEPLGAGGVTLTGVARAVPFAHVADRVLVPAVLGDGVVVAVRRSRRQGRPARAGGDHQSRDPPASPSRRGRGRSGRSARRTVIPSAGHEVLSWMLQRAWTGLCALQVGVIEAAVTQTAAYLNTREQFGRPLSTFQGTMLRAADAAIDTETVRVSMWQAAWRLDNGLDCGTGGVVWPRGSPPRPASVPCSPPSTCTAGSAPTSPIRSTATSSGASRSSCMLGPPSAHLARLGRQVVEARRAERSGRQVVA